jgi:uncharacterized protein with HEPN domain
MSKEPLFFLEHILICIEDIEHFTSGKNKSDFLKDKLLQNGVIREIEVIGEAVKNLRIDFAIKYPHVEWNKIAGTRDKLIHNYFGVDLDLVWDIVKRNLPLLKKDIKEIVKEIK